MRVRDLFGSEDRRADKQTHHSKSTKQKLIQSMIDITRTLLRKKTLSRGHKACNIFRQNDRTLI